MSTIHSKGRFLRIKFGIHFGSNTSQKKPHADLESQIHAGNTNPISLCISRRPDALPTSPDAAFPPAINVRSAGIAHRPPTVQFQTAREAESTAMMAFWTCSRFSASSNTTERGLSRTACSTSSPGWAGRQCMKSASGLAAAKTLAVTA